jgi:hypothetical protein
MANKGKRKQKLKIFEELTHVREQNLKSYGN